MAQTSGLRMRRTVVVWLASLYVAIGALPSQAQGDLTPTSIEYTRAQVIDWIDDEIFAVGRLDGSLALFRIPYDGEHTPVLLQVRVIAEGAGAEMVAALDDRRILFSDGPAALGMWVRESDATFGQYYRFPHSSSLGIANSAAVVRSTGGDLVVTGHANGFAKVWEWRGNDLKHLRTIDLRSADPVPSPYSLKNIRGLVSWKDGIVLSGSEDGDIVAFRPSNGTIVFRQRYNPEAKRGINNISLHGNKLLVANCSVGKTDKNLWLYAVTETGVELLDAVNLVKDTALTQSFDFDADLYLKSGALRFFASTQEGLLWAGAVDGGKLRVDGMTAVASEGGAILDVSASGHFLAAAAHRLFLFHPD